jgi:hypothetical protein
MSPLPPPEPPQNREQFLQELVNYYRAMLDYHQRAVALAASSLAHAEAMLMLNSGQSLLKERLAMVEPAFHNGLKGAESSIAPKLTNPEPLEAIALGTSLPSLETLEKLLNDNRGKMLQLDYIVRILCGRLADKELNLVTQVVEQLLELGASQGRWASVPDSPECWTIDLQEFPELAVSSKKDKIRRRGEPRLPASERLDRYRNLTEAVTSCLEENAPKAMNINDMLDWFYPDGLLPEQKKRARQAIRDVIMKKCNQVGCWKRFAVGLYVPNPGEVASDE